MKQKEVGQVCICLGFLFPFLSAYTQILRKFSAIFTSSIFLFCIFAVGLCFTQITVDMVMKISRICIWVLILGTVMVFSSCANEHPKEQLDGNAMYGSASEIYNHTVSSLYQDIDFVEHSEEEDSLYAVWSHLYQVIGKANQSLDIIDYKSDLLSVNQKDQF